MELSRTDKVINAMQDEIKKHGLELMSRYPDDLLKHDRFAIEVLEGCTAKLAWCVGHSHTHIATLGVNEEQNHSVTYYTNLANDDRFYLIELKSKGDFKLKEVSKSQFLEFESEPIPFKVSNSGLNFDLFKNNVRIATCNISVTGYYANKKYLADLRSAGSITAVDKIAMEHAAKDAIRYHEGSLFYNAESKWDQHLEPTYGAAKRSPRMN